MVRRARGFTLIELLVVMVIAVLALTVVPPMLSGTMAHMEVKSAVREVAAGLKLARSQAIAAGSSRALLVDTRRHVYFLEGESRRHALPEGVDLTVNTVAAEATEDGLLGMRFFPDGSSTGGSLVFAGAGERYRVEVDWLTGRVRIPRGGAES